MKGFRKTFQGIVDPAWIDQNNHMNVMWYTWVFDRGCESLLREIGISQDTLRKGEPTVVAGRLYVAHRRELMPGEAFELWSGLVRVKAEFLTFTHRLVSQGQIRAVCDIRSNAFCPLRRMKTELSQERLELAKALMVPGLADRFEGE